MNFSVYSGMKILSNGKKTVFFALSGFGFWGIITGVIYLKMQNTVNASPVQFRQ
jgi:hypothetical protein